MEDFLTEKGLGIAGEFLTKEKEIMTAFAS
jgi:hypothetical protein